MAGQKYIKIKNGLFSCVGFTTFLELSENIVDEVLALLDAEAVVNDKWAAFQK